ncbi:MAG: DinB family protein, partial [Anaerolineales bacterium]|nr:DinB family protein [Anaerolineales bacterium]
MNANEVLIDLLDDNQRRLKRMLKPQPGPFPEACLGYQPDPGANNITVTLWHMGRLFDLFLNQFVLGQPAAEEAWFRGGFAACYSYNPLGLGQDGWGTLNGYTPDEVRAMPVFSLEDLLAYLDQVYAEVRAYLLETPEADLFLPAPGFEGRFTRYQVIQMALMDNIRHLGELYA